MKRIIYFFLLVAPGTFPCHGQIAAWDFYGQSFPVTCTATTFQSNLVNSGGASEITRGPGAPASGGVHSFRTTGFMNNGISVSSTDYFQVTLQPAPGYKLSLSSIDAKFNGTSTFFASPGVTSQFAYSLDGSNFTLIGLPVQSTSLTMAQLDISGIAGLQNVYNGTVVTLRYYASGQTSTGGWGFYSAAPGTNGLSIGGLVEPAVVVPPSVQASAISFSNVQQTQMSVSWIPGNGEKRIVSINTMNSFTDPPDGTDPVANPVYGGTGEQVIYNNSGSSIPAVTGLSLGVTYWFRIYEYNGTGMMTRYNISTSTGNPASQSAMSVLLPPSIGALTRSEVTDHSAKFGAHITASGGTPVTEHGTVWSTWSPVTLNDHRHAEAGTDTGLFVHLRDTLPPAMLIRFAAYAINAAGSAMTGEGAFYTLATAPAGHVTEFQATQAGSTSASLTWEPLASGADGYLVIQSQGSLPPAGTPADSTYYVPGDAIGDGTVAANISDGAASSATITGLTPGTIYSFKIYPYAWDGLHSQTCSYQTTLPAPWDSAMTTLPGAVTYHWTGAVGTSWTEPANWTPQRIVPAPNDILIFDIGGVWTIVNVPAQTIGQLKVQSYTGITLQGGGTLALAGGEGEDLTVSYGSHLNLGGANPVTISLAAGVHGSISGEITLSGGGHRLLAATSGGLVFNTGSQFKAGSGFSGNPFGLANLNSVIFTSGSTYVSQAGGNPFGAPAPASVVIFQPGSRYRLDAYAVPSFAGRTYGDFEMNFPGMITVSGSMAVTIGDFIASQGTFYFNMTGSPGHSIRGDIFVSSLATLIFAPASAGSVNFNGASPQSIHGFGSLMAQGNSTLVCSNSAGVTLGIDATFNNMTISNGGVFTISPNAALTVNGILVNGNPMSGVILEPDGSLIHPNSGVTGLVKRNIAAADWSDWQDGWHLLASPVGSQAIGASGGFITTGSGNDYDLYAWSEPVNRWVNFKNNLGPPLFITVNGGVNFVPGRGYLAAYQQSGVKTFSGEINVTDVSLPGLTRTSDTSAFRGWNLLGNPYPCAVTWYEGWNAVNIGGVAMAWNEAGMSYTPVNAGEPIPACNGFMVQVMGTAGSTGSLTIPASQRIHSQQAWYKEACCPVIRLVAKEAGGRSFQECQVRLDPRSSVHFDPVSDGRFLPGYAPLLYTVCGSERLSVNSLPAEAMEVSLPVHFVANRSGGFELEARFTGEEPAAVWLTDRRTGASQELIAEPVYRFNASGADPADRFILTIHPPGSNPAGAGQPAVIVQRDGLLVSYRTGTRLEVFDIAGRNLFTRVLNGKGREAIPMKVPAGLYLVRTTVDGNVKVTKVCLHSTI